MKYFTLAAAFIGAISASSEVEIYLERDQARLSELKDSDPDCYGSGYDDFKQQQLDNALGSNDNYLVRTKTINNGGSRFMTITCKFSPWQHNDQIYDPYGEDRKWNKTLGPEFAKWQDDRAAMKKWLANRNAENWPARVGGRYRCGMYNGVRRWNVIKAIEWNCPDHDIVGEWKKFVEANPIKAELENPAFADGRHQDVNNPGVDLAPARALDGERYYTDDQNGYAHGYEGVDFTANLKESCVVSQIVIYTRRDYLDNGRYEAMEVYIDNQECTPENTFNTAWLMNNWQDGLKWTCNYTGKGKDVRVSNPNGRPIQIAELEVYC